MPDNPDIIIATKCAPEERLLSCAEEAALLAVELYTDINRLKNIDEIIKVCSRFSLRYTLHAPNDGYNPKVLAELAEAINAEAVVFHNIYWEKEWEEIINIFEQKYINICIENIQTVLEPLKFIRRYGVKRCLDLEHFQLECGGVYEKILTDLIRQSSHIHLTGYIFGSDLWHTPIHSSPKHNIYLLDLIKRVGYSGFIVSEASTEFQNLKEFKELNEFFKKWKSR